MVISSVFSSKIHVLVWMIGKINSKLTGFTLVGASASPGWMLEAEESQKNLRAKIRLFVSIDCHFFDRRRAILISFVSNSYYGMPRGQIHTCINCPHEHPIMSFETI